MPLFCHKQQQEPSFFQMLRGITQAGAHHKTLTDKCLRWFHKIVLDVISVRLSATQLCWVEPYDWARLDTRGMWFLGLGHDFFLRHFQKPLRKPAVLRRRYFSLEIEHACKTVNHDGLQAFEPRGGLEPPTYALRMRCSTNWAKVANNAAKLQFFLFVTTLFSFFTLSLQPI